MQHIPKLTTATELNYNLLADKTNELIDQVAFYKSIVKAVDPDNLPEYAVLILDQKGELYCEGLFEENGKVVGFLNSTHEITHYIETKDIIKMMGDL